MDLILVSVYTITGSVFSFTHAADRAGLKRSLYLFFLAFGTSLLFEIVGSKTGFLFGNYNYSGTLGPSFLNQVPYLVPLTWFMMLYSSTIISLRIVPKRKSRIVWLLMVASIGGLIMTSLDLVLDPIMVFYRHWEWMPEGVYFGIPLSNYTGWWVTSFLIIASILTLGRITQYDFHLFSGVFNRLPVVSYAITGVISILVAVDSGLLGPAVVACVAMFLWVFLGWDERKIPL